MFDSTIGPANLKGGRGAPQLRGKTPRMGQLLLKRGVISQRQLDIAMQEQAVTGERLGKILVTHGYASPADVSKALRGQHKYFSAITVLMLQVSSLVMSGGHAEQHLKASKAQAQYLSVLPPVAETKPSSIRFTELFQEQITKAQLPDKRVSHSLNQAELAKLRLPKDAQQRLESFLPHVHRAAEQFDVPAALILGVIHTESHFRKNASSSMNAHGLMQIVPRFAGKEAYPAVYKKAGAPSLKQLRDPGTNILLGAAYLRKLDRVYFKRIANDAVRRAAVIAAYNVGPSKLLRIFKLRGTPANVAELKQILAEHTPMETQAYLSKVTVRSQIYSAAQSRAKTLARNTARLPPQPA
tara:strand:- start:5109 stop:6173 length:1065 start_codon:yes stop_codon:yes gene_type:complete